MAPKPKSSPNPTPASGANTIGATGGLSPGSAVSASQAVSQFKSALTKLKRRTKFVTWRESGDYAFELTEILHDLKGGVTNPRVGIEMVASFFRADAKVFEACDDSSGNVGDVYTFDARELFVHYAAQFEDKAWLADLLLDLQRDDNYGVRDCLVDAASQFLPEPEIRLLIERLWILADAEARIYDKRHWLFSVESLARQIHDAPLFERAVLASMEGEIHNAGCLEIAEVYLEAGDAPTALSWLGKVPDTTFDGGKRDKLLLEAHKVLGNRREATETAWRIFRRYRHEETFGILLENIGPHDRQRLLDAETRLILDSQNLSYSDARFLIWLNRIEDAQKYLLSHLQEIDGDSYPDVLSLAQPMEEAERYLTTSILFRALLESILRRAISKYYTHGVRYLRKLDALAPKVTDWQNFLPHEVYFSGLEKAHARKSSFWERYRSPR